MTTTESTITDLNTASAAVQATRELASAAMDIADPAKRALAYEALSFFIQMADVTQNVRTRMEKTLATARHLVP